MTMTSNAPHLAAPQQPQIDPIAAQQLIQGQLAQQQALLAQQQRQYPQQQMTPYGFLGDIAGAVLPQAGSWVGQQLGSPQLGQQFGGIAGQLAQRFSPWQAAPASGMPQQQQQQYPQQQYPQAQQQYPQQQYPQAQQQMTPYGFLGDFAGSVLPDVGSWVGQQLGSPQLGQQIGGIAGQLAQQFSPWQAGMPQQQHPQQGQYPQAQHPQQGQYPQQQYGQHQHPQAQLQYAQQAAQAQHLAQAQQAAQQVVQAQQLAQQAQQLAQQVAQSQQGAQPQQQMAPFGLFGGSTPFGANPGQYAGYPQQGMPNHAGYPR
jgi:hypothetical protein